MDRYFHPKEVRKLLKSKLLKSEMRAAFLLLIPVFALYIIFVVAPALTTAYLSFTQFSGFGNPTWVGLENFQRVINDSQTQKTLFNTLYFTVGTVFLSIISALFLAVLLNQPLKGRAIFRSIIYLPVVAPMLAVAFVWKFMLDPSPSGLNNYLTNLFGLGAQQWLSNTRLAMPSVILVSVWKALGYKMVIFLAGLQGIPEQLYEAAEIDGANFFQKFLYITIPLLKPVTTFVFITSTINAFQAFEQIYGMTSGGPANSTYTLAYLIYVKGFRSLKFGEASALAVILVFIVFIFSMLYIRQIAKEK